MRSVIDLIARDIERCHHSVPGELVDHPEVALHLLRCPTLICADKIDHLHRRSLADDRRVALTSTNMTVTSRSPSSAGA